jgi:hypothetical protein
MQQLEPNALLAGSLAVIGFIVWLIRLEAKVKEVDRSRIADLDSIRQQRVADDRLTTERFSNIKDSLDAINVKLDQLQKMNVDQIRAFIAGGGNTAGT